MRFFLILSILGTSLIILSACAAGPADDDQSGFLTPVPPKTPDPTNKALHAAVESFLRAGNAPIASSYVYSRVDLNNDRRRDAIVMFKTPYGYWCGTHGCSMLIFRALDDRFTLMNAVQPIREPVYVGPTNTKGWRDIVVRVSGRSDKAKNVTLRFDGRKYPNNPTNLAPLLRFDDTGYLRLFRNAY